MFGELFSPHFSFSAILDGVDLSGVHFVAAFLGAILALYVMQLWSRGAVEVIGDCFITSWARRLALTILALAMLWSLAYSATKGWQPWPPDIIALVAIDLMLLSTIVVAKRRKRALG